MSAPHRIAHSAITKKFRLESEQLLFHRGRGGLVEDTAGSTYVDFVMGYGPVILGHALPEFGDRLRTYLDHGVMMPGYTTFHEQYLERLLADRPDTGGAFFKTGSEAVTASLRIAAAETGRLGVIRAGYIGWHDAHIADSLKWHEPLHSPLRGHVRYTSGMRGVGVDEPVANWADLRLTSLDRLLAEGEGTLGCLVFDAYLASLTTLEVLMEAIARCRAAGLLVVFDETKTGGRISRMGYAHDHGLDVDLVVIGKALANGAPLSILVGPKGLLAEAERSRLSGTFSKEMLAIYAALITIELMERPWGGHKNGWEAVAACGRAVAERINAATVEAGVARHVWGQPVLGGGMFELAYGEEVIGQKARRGVLLEHLMVERILLLEGHPSFVCLAHGNLDQEELGQRFARAFAAWRTSLESHLA